MLFFKRIIKHYGVIIKNIVHNPKDTKYLGFPKNVKSNGIVLVIHESNRLGASLLLLHIAEEMIKQGENVFIITRQFGELNDEYARVAPTQIIFKKRLFRKTLLKLKEEYGYRRILFVTASVGDLTKIAHDCGYKVVSAIHELAYVIRYLHKEKMADEMLNNSDFTVFSTSVAKNEVLNLLNIDDNKHILIRPQGIYYNKPNEKEIKIEKNKLISKIPSLLNNPVIIGVGNTSKRKGFDTFLAVADLMPSYNFLWAGKKENYYNLVVNERHGNIPDNFYYAGSLNSSELAAVYDIGDVLFMCSRKDTLPSVIFESLLFGDPVIGSKKSGGIVDVIDDSNGVLIDDYSTSDFANAIKHLFNEKNRFNKNELINKAKNYKFDLYVSFIIDLFKK